MSLKKNNFWMKDSECQFKLFGMIFQDSQRNLMNE